MKVLSVKGLWAYLIALGIKDVENRKKLKNIRGWHLIHVSKDYSHYHDYDIPAFKLELKERYKAFDKLEKLDYMTSGKKKLKTGCIIGAMYIDDSEYNNHSGLHWGEYGVNNLLLSSDKAILFDKPIEGVRGQLSVWNYELPQEYIDKYPELKVK